MDGRTAETGDDGRTSEEAAAGLCLQLDLGDTGMTVHPLGVFYCRLNNPGGPIQTQLPVTEGDINWSYMGSSIPP